jgi:hypothetical protein
MDAIRKRAEAATEGPWIADDNEGYGIWSIWYGSCPSGNVEPRGLVAQCPGDDAQVEEDADFIAHAREDIPTLLAEIARLKEELRSRNDMHALAVRRLELQIATMIEDEPKELE